MTKMLKILLLPLISVSLFAEWPGDSWQLSSVLKTTDFREIMAMVFMV